MGGPGHDEKSDQIACVRGSAVADNAVLEIQTLGDGRRQAARFKAGKGRLGSQDRRITHDAYCIIATHNEICERVYRGYATLKVRPMDDEAVTRPVAVIRRTTRI